MKRVDNININNKRGFTLMELMIAVTIIGILATIAYPSYQQYVIKTKRVDMMAEMHNIASQIQSRKLAQGKYSVISAAIIKDFTVGYPKDQALYDIKITPNPLTSNWKITATPKPGTQMAGDGNLSLNSLGQKCRATQCGMSDEWRN
ncbi:type IV pilin protein [Psychrobacter sp. CAL346-MNA-CIBAN-0220]|uniref:type IV pilin protein n=1 Tax=Psychrobacter sp. CAL346-MNA-CIBAN-0220 TaxID=3140457 RepID=UPI00332A316D